MPGRIELRQQRAYASHTAKKSFAPLPEELQDAHLPWYDGHEGLVLAGGAVTSMVVSSATLRTALQCTSLLSYPRACT